MILNIYIGWRLFRGADGVHIIQDDDDDDTNFLEKNMATG